MSRVERKGKAIVNKEAQHVHWEKPNGNQKNLMYQQGNEFIAFSKTPI
jgi:hypothetical protein